MNKKLLSIVVMLSLFGCNSVSDNNIVDISNISSNNIKSLIDPPPQAKRSNRTLQDLKKEASELREVYSKPKSQWPKPELDLETPENVEFKELGTLTPVKYPSDNTASDKKASLGKALFFDMRLSGSKKLSCMSCHNPNMNWGDDQKTPLGHEGAELKRNSPSVVNAAYSKTQFWDGRAVSLEEQAVAVLTNPNEMHSTPESIAETVNSIDTYKKQFKEAYGVDRITIQHVAKALANFERTVVTKNRTPFDQFLVGNKEALSDSAVRGLHLFRTQGRCMNCHNGANFTDDKYHNLGMTSAGTDFEDLGRYYVTSNKNDWGRFRTPSLRNVEFSAPYMHRGNLRTIKRVLEQYNHGFQGEQEISPLIKTLNLYEEDLIDLEEFLKSLSEPVSK
jgi:cytochrome c peroxidase